MLHVTYITCYISLAKTIVYMSVPWTVSVLPSFCRALLSWSDCDVNNNFANTTSKYAMHGLWQLTNK